VELAELGVTQENTKKNSVGVHLVELYIVLYNSIMKNKTMVNPTGVFNFIFYFIPQFRKLHWGLCTVYTYGVITVKKQNELCAQKLIVIKN
jgi:hypothetical protein